MMQKKLKYLACVGFLSLAVSVGMVARVSVCSKKKEKDSVTKLSLQQGKTKKLRWKKVSKCNQKRIHWKSSNQKIVSVSSNGTIRARKKGKATITASFKKKKHKYIITVKSKEKNKQTISNPIRQGNDTAQKADDETVTAGKTLYRGFITDNVLHSKKNGEIHYNVYFPKSGDTVKQYALYVTLPGYQGLYFQGVAENIKTEDFGFEAQKYNSNMIILAPQLNDWGQTSADQTIALVEYFLRHYKIDASKVYINGYSGGGETLSLVLGKRPELFAAALMCSSQWDGKYMPVVKAKTPVYFVIGESDEYYGQTPFKKAYQTLYDLYKKQGMSEKQIHNLLVLDIKGADYFAGTKVTYQHGGGYLFCRDKNIMGWLFNH